MRGERGEERKEGDPGEGRLGLQGTNEASEGQEEEEEETRKTPIWRLWHMGNQSINKGMDNNAGRVFPTSYNQAYPNESSLDMLSSRPTTQDVQSLAGVVMLVIRVTEVALYICLTHARMEFDHHTARTDGLY